jgi:hypothetical protein
MLPKPFVFLATFSFTTACSPLVPLSYVDGSTNSQLTQSIETDDATVWLQYMTSQHGYMVFDLEIANHSQHPLPVAPQLVSFYASSKTFVPLQTGDDVHALSAPNSTLTLNRHFAADPSSIQRFYLDKAKSQKVGAGIFAVLTVGLIIFDIAEDSKDVGKEVYTSRDELKSFGRDVMVATAVTATDIAQSSAQQTAVESHFLPYELFPECTIESGNNVRGKIFIPTEYSHKYVRVIVPLNDADYVFDFRRRGVKN